MLLFKDLKQNYQVFMLNTQDMTFNQGKVVSVSFPHFDMNNHSMVGIGSNSTNMVVDITLEFDGKTSTYVIPENISITRTGNGNLILATEKEGIVREIEALKSSSEQVLASVDYHKGVVEKADKLLAEFNPILKERQATEQRFKQIENNVGEMKQMLERFLNDISNNKSQTQN